MTTYIDKCRKTLEEMDKSHREHNYQMELKYSQMQKKLSQTQNELNSKATESQELKDQVERMTNELQAAVEKITSLKYELDSSAKNEASLVKEVVQTRNQYTQKLETILQEFETLNQEDKNLELYTRKLDEIKTYFTHVLDQQNEACLFEKMRMAKIFETQKSQMDSKARDLEEMMQKERIKSSIAFEELQTKQDEMARVFQEYQDLKVRKLEQEQQYNDMKFNYASTVMKQSQQISALRSTIEILEQSVRSGKDEMVQKLENVHLQNLVETMEQKVQKSRAREIDLIEKVMVLEKKGEGTISALENSVDELMADRERLIKERDDLYEMLSQKGSNMEEEKRMLKKII